MVVKMVKMNHVGVAVSVAMFASLLLSWWSIRANGVSIDIYPYGVRAGSVTTYDTDWVVDSLLALDGTFLLVSLIVVVSGILTVAGKLGSKALALTDRSSSVESHGYFHLLWTNAIRNR